MEHDPLADLGFDDLLTAAAPAISPTAAALAAELATETSLTQLRHAQPRRSRYHALAGIAAALLLIGGATAAYPLLRAEPGVTTAERVATGIPVSYTDAAGRDVDCLAFLEVSGLNAAQRRALNLLAASPSWKGYGDRLVDDLGVRDASPRVQRAAIEAAVGDDVWPRAHAVLPELSRQDQSAARPQYRGAVVSCPDEENS